MKSGFTINRIKRLISTVSVILSVTVFTLAAADELSPEIAGQHTKADYTEGLPVQALTNQYSERIVDLELEISAQSERRTEVVRQLDQAINMISALENKSQSVRDQAPPLSESQQALNAEIAALEKDIRLNAALLEQLQQSLDSQPELSIWQAALGSPQVQKRRKLLATQSYLVYTAQKHQHQLRSKRKLLDKRFQSLVDYENDVRQSVNKMQNDFDLLVEQRQDLELQLSEISSLIATKQDRISSLAERSAQATADPAALYFGKLENKLRDPVEGRVIRAFSEPKAKGLLKWNGILVEAPLGLPFTSVSDGVVVFADELQGLGNVAIVDHGHGYMTLYGMAELLLVEKDQFLLAGDAVGTVGEYIGADTSALYFEVRHNADTLNPQNWLQMHLITQKNTR